MAQIIAITDWNQPELDLFARLTQAQLKNRRSPDQGIFIAESPKVIRLALEGGCRPVAFLMEEKHITGDARELIARCPEAPVYTGPREVLANLTGYALTRGVLCAMRRPPEREVDEICAGARRLAVLEDLVDPTNVGAVFRSAAALGMDGVLLTPACCDPLHRRAARVSMGTVFQIPWARLPRWPEEGLARLKTLGFTTAALALGEDSFSMEDPRLPQIHKLALLLGTEGDGLAPETVARCDLTIRIPMGHGVDSLNVAAASAVAFWQLRVRGSAASDPL